MDPEKITISSRERQSIQGLTQRSRLSLQHEVLIMSCWCRCRRYFANDESVADVVMQIIVYLVARYLGPREFPLANSVRTSPFLKRVYHRIPGGRFIECPTAIDVVMNVFLIGLGGRIR